MTNYLSEFKRCMQPLVADGRLRIVDERYYPQHFGNSSLVLDGARVRFHLESDRSQVLASICALDDLRHWWDLRPLLRYLLPGETVGSGPWESVEELRDRIQANLERLETFVGSRDPALVGLPRAPG